MATWTYSSWRRQSTAAGRLEYLALHLEEIEEKITADVSAHGYSRQNHPLLGLLTLLEKKYDEMAAAAGAGGGTSYATFTRPG